MQIIEINALENGAHRNQSWTGGHIPDGWAAVSGNITIPDTFPFVDIEVDENGTVTAMTPREVPQAEPEPEAEPEATQLDRIEAQTMYTALMTDTLLEEV